MLRDIPFFSKLYSKMYESLRYCYYKQKYSSFYKKYDVNPTFKFNGNFIKFYGKGKIICGEKSYIGSNSSVQSGENTKVVIGKKCSISHNVRIYTKNLVADQNMSKNNLEKNYGDVTIGDFCWIGANVFITEGVTIGENSVIGANSVVTKDIPSHCIAAGCPAKVIKYKSYLDKKS